MPKKAIPASKEGEVRSGNGTVQISVRPLGSTIQAVLAELSQFRVQCFWCWVKGRKAWGFSSTGFLKKGDTQGRQSLRKRNPSLSLFSFIASLWQAPQPVQSEGFTPAPERAVLREQLISSRLISLANALGLRNRLHLPGVNRLGGCWLLMTLCLSQGEP